MPLPHATICTRLSPFPGNFGEIHQIIRLQASLLKEASTAGAVEAQKEASTAGAVEAQKTAMRPVVMLLAFIGVYSIGSASSVRVPPPIVVLNEKMAGRKFESPGGRRSFVLRIGEAKVFLLDAQVRGHRKRTFFDATSFSWLGQPKDSALVATSGVYGTAGVYLWTARKSERIYKPAAGNHEISCVIVKVDRLRKRVLVWNRNEDASNLSQRKWISFSR